MTFEIEQSKSSKGYSLAIYVGYVIIAIIFIILSTYELNRPPTDLHQFRQTQTLSTIENYLRTGINLLQPEIDTNGKNSIVILEFPLYQAIGALLLKYSNGAIAALRLFGIIFILTSAYLFAREIDKKYKRGSGLPFFIAVLISPMMVFWSAVPLIDSFSVSLGLIALALLLRGFRKNNYFIIWTAVFIAVITAIVKVTTLFLIGLVYVVIDRERFFQKKNIKLFFSASATIISVFAAWIFYSKSMHIENPHEYTKFSLNWFLGTQQQWIDISIYQHFLHRLEYNHIGILILANIAIITISRKNFRDLFDTILLIICSTTYLIAFINLNYTHTYYQLPLSVVFGLIAAIAANSLLAMSNKLFFVYVSILTILSTGLTHNYIHHQWKDHANVISPYQHSPCEQLIAQQLKLNGILELAKEPTNYIVFEGDPYSCWNGPHAIMYHTGFRGHITREIDINLFREFGYKHILYIANSAIPPVFEDFYPIITGNLTHPVDGYSYYLLVPIENIDTKMISEHISIDRNIEVSGSPSTSVTLADFSFPLKPAPFSKLSVKFKVINKCQDCYGFVLLRSYTTGYSADIVEKFRIREGFYTGEFQLRGIYDYILHFGVFSDAKLSIEGPIELNISNHQNN